MQQKILVVCAANQCRSPYAEAFLRHHIQQQNLQAEWSAESAGVRAASGRMATEATRQLATERGFDLSNHRSRSIDEVDLSSFALILTMEEGHKEVICIEHPTLAKRVLMVSELMGLRADVEDPIGHSLATYRTTFRQIERYLTSGWNKLLKLAGQTS